MKVNFEMVLGFLSGVDPELEPFVSDLKAAEADGKIDLSEIETLVADAGKVAENHWGPGAPLIEDVIAQIRLAHKFQVDIAALSKPASSGS